MVKAISDSISTKIGTYTSTEKKKIKAVAYYIKHKLIQNGGKKAEGEGILMHKKVGAPNFIILMGSWETLTVI